MKLSLISVFLQFYFYSVINNVIHISCIGDSITSGNNCEGGGVYTDDLQQLLGENYVVSNYGNSGQTMLKKGLCGPPAGGDCSYWNTQTYIDVMNSNPNIVTIMLGTNDAKTFNWEGVQQNLGDYFALDYTDMINNIKMLPSKPKIYLIIPPPLTYNEPYQMNHTIINTIYPKLITEIAQVNQVDGIIDVYSALKSDDWDQFKLTCDGCHPNVQGHQIIANTIYDFIKKQEINMNKRTI